MVEAANKLGSVSQGKTTYASSASRKKQVRTLYGTRIKDPTGSAIYRGSAVRVCSCYFIEMAGKESSTCTDNLPLQLQSAIDLLQSRSEIVEPMETDLLENIPEAETELPLHLNLSSSSH